MNIPQEYLDNISNIAKARIEAVERMAKASNRRFALQKSFNKAVANSENIDSEGKINWSFVDSDMHLDGYGANGGEFKTMVYRHGVK